LTVANECVAQAFAMMCWMDESKDSKSNRQRRPNFARLDRMDVNIVHRLQLAAQGDAWHR